MNELEFWQIDVFTTRRYQGNPAAVVFDAADLTTEVMQAIAREMNLSETVFVQPPVAAGADYKVRMFTPRSEMPFAGHPTLATAYAMVNRGGGFQGVVPLHLRQECGIGIVPVEVRRSADGSLTFVMTQASPRWIDVPITRAACAALLGCASEDVLDLPIQVVSTGVPWLIIPLRAPADVAGLRPDAAGIERTCRQYGAVGVTTFAIGAEDAATQVKVRTFAPGEGVSEDPVCGSGNGSVAAYIAATSLLGGADFAYEAQQGIEVARPGTVLVRCERRPDGNLQVSVGGHAVKVLEGTLFL